MPHETPLPFDQFYHQTTLIRLTLCVLGATYKIAEANNSAIQYFNTSRDSFIQNTFDNFLDQDNIDYVNRAIDMCIESKVSISIQMIPNSLDNNFKVQSFLLEPILDNSGEETVQFIDIKALPPTTQTSSLERERDDAISMFTTVFDLSEIGITVTDHHGRFVRLNHAFTKQTGWQEIDLMGEDIFTIIPKDDHEKAVERQKDIFRERRKNFGETRVLCKDGRILNTMVTSVIMELSNGRNFRISTVFDITHLKQIEMELRQARDNADKANMAKSAFLANMSHELRTPLNAIIGFSEMMISGTLGAIENDHYQEYLGDIKFSAQHLLQIINDVLDMSKIEAGKMPLNDEDIHIQNLLESVVRLLHSKAQEKHIDISIESCNDIHNILGDERLLRQIFLNILSNAIKFSHNNSKILIKICVNSRGFDITFQDFGIGIPEERLNDIMEPFGQITDPQLNKGQGTGLGLPIAKAMMKMHGGHLDVHSKPGQGTTVNCHFPTQRLKQADNV